MSISMRSVVRLSSSDSSMRFRLVMQEERGIEQVHADDAQRLLLQAVFVIEHAHVDEDLAVFIARMSLIFDAHPAVALVGALIIARRNGIGEGEESGGVAARCRRSRSRLRLCSWSSMLCRRSRET